MTSRTQSPRVAYWKEARRRGSGLFAGACASLEDIRATLPLAPDLILFHPGFCDRTSEGETGMLSGLGFLGNANLAALEQAGTILPASAPCPVALGVCGTDPYLKRPNALLDWKENGVEGICNFPTVGLVDGHFREDLEAEGMGFAREADCLNLARQVGLFTVGIACHPEEAASLRAQGCDILILHLGLDADFSPRGLDSAGDMLNSYLYAIRGGEGPIPLLLLHGDAVDAAGAESGLRDLVGAGSPWDGLLATGGASRIRALHAACPWARPSAEVG